MAGEYRFASCGILKCCLWVLLWGADAATVSRAAAARAQLLCTALHWQHRCQTFAIRDSDAVSAKISWRACSQALLVTAKKDKRFLVCRYASSALQLKGRRALIDAQDNESERR